MESSSVVEFLHRKAYLAEWCEEEYSIKSVIPADSPRYWQCVAKHNNLNDFVIYALISLITPVSNTIVKIMF